MADVQLAGTTNLNNSGVMWLIVLVSWLMLHFLGSGFLLVEIMSSCGLQDYLIKLSTFITDTSPESVRY
jgi:hypothetical protein